MVASRTLPDLLTPSSPSDRFWLMNGRPSDRIVAIVLNWNGGVDTLTCLQSICAADQTNVQILLADNGSVDGSVERAKKEIPEIEVLTFETNHGYAGGNNRALRHAFGELKADWVCLLNNDVLVGPELFARLAEGVDEAEKSGGVVGAAGPCISYLDERRRVWACGGSIGGGINVTQLRWHERALEKVKDLTQVTDVDYVPGACLLLSRAGWEKTGPLDEDFFCYMEDVDYCLRLRDAGFRVVAVPSARVAHGLSLSTGGGYSAGRKYMTAVNSVHFLRKHGTPFGWFAFLFFDLLLWPLAFLQALFTGRVRGALAKLRGAFAGLLGVRVDASVAARFARRTE